MNSSVIYSQDYPCESRTSDLAVFGPLMTTFATSEAIFWSRRAIKEGATEKVLAIKLAAPGNKPRNSMARRGKTWNRWGKTEETCLMVSLVEVDFKTFSALSSARRIFIPSSSFSASSCCEYSSTVFQSNSDVSANKFNSCLASGVA